MPTDQPTPNRMVTWREIGRSALFAVGPHRGGLYALCALAVLVGLLETGLLYLTAQLAVSLTSSPDSITLALGPLDAGDVSRSSVLVAAGVLVVILIGLSFAVGRLSAGVSAQALGRAREELISAYLQAEWATRSMHSEGHLQEMASDYCQRTERLVQQLVTAVVAGCAFLTLVLGALVASPLAALIMFGGLGLIALILKPFSSKLRMGSSRYAKANKRFSSLVAQTARMAPVIASYHVEEGVQQSLTGPMEESAAAIKRLRFVARVTPMLFQYAALGLVVAQIAVLSLFDGAVVTAIAAVMLIVIRALGYVKQLQTAVQQSHEFAPYATGLEQEVSSLREVAAATTGVAIGGMQTVDLRGVDFAYPNGKAALKGVDLTIAAGEAIGIVGPSGSGKTTLVSLLLHLRRPTSGVIMVGDTPLDDIDPADWARQVAFVPQQNEIIRGSITDNIAFYRAGYTEDEVIGAARRAHIHDEILDLPSGYDTEIGPGARDLSGGQRQRLGIARALLGGPSLLVLDEPTSALDSRSEQLIRQTLEELKGTATLVVVAHRPETLDVCDRYLSVTSGVVEPVLRSVATPSAHPA